MNSKFAKSLTLISTACFLYKTRLVLSFFFSMRSLASTKRATRQTAGARSVTATTVTSLPPPAERGHGAPTQEPPKERDPSPRATRRARPDRREVFLERRLGLLRGPSSSGHRRELTGFSVFLSRSRFAGTSTAFRARRGTSAAMPREWEAARMR